MSRNQRPYYSRHTPHKRHARSVKIGHRISVVIDASFVIRSFQQVKNLLDNSQVSVVIIPTLISELRIIRQKFKKAGWRRKFQIATNALRLFKKFIVSRSYFDETAHSVHQRDEMYCLAAKRLKGIVLTKDSDFRDYQQQDPYRKIGLAYNISDLNEMIAERLHLQGYGFAA